ncbi:MAG: LysR family transcriptional regulator [Rubrivivax sp.]|nr:MAG: LysR family transcriptional regulator [Rubrivivax sp.]
MQKRFPKMQSPSGDHDADEAPLGFDWNDLKYFLAVARHGGLSKAALQLNTSASTVSRHIGALEGRLQVRLFVRLSTGYLLTDAGSELFDRVAEVERSTHAVERRSSVAGEADKVTGLLRLAASDSVGVLLLTPRLPLLRQRHPGLRVELTLGHAQADLSRREADVALRIFDANLTGAHPDHVVHRIADMALGLYASPNVLAGRDPGQLDWRNADHIAWDLNWRHLASGKWLAKAFPSRPPVFTTNSVTAQLAAIQVGLGVGVLPDFVARTDPSLVRLPVDTSELTRELWLVYHRDLRGSRRVQALREFIEEHVPPAMAF